MPSHRTGAGRRRLRPGGARVYASPAWATRYTGSKTRARLASTRWRRRRECSARTCACCRTSPTPTPRRLVGDSRSTGRARRALLWSTSGFRPPVFGASCSSLAPPASSLTSPRKRRLRWACRCGTRPKVAGDRCHRPCDLSLDPGARWGTIECVTGWIFVVLVPVALWALLVTFLVIVFRSGPAVEMEEPVLEVQPVRDLEPVREPSRERSALGWLPPVAPHH